MDPAPTPSFAADGYLVRHGVLGADQVAAVADAVATAPERGGADNPLTLGAMHFRSNLFYGSAVLRRLLSSPPVLDLVVGLLGPSAWVRWDQAVWKRPGAPTFPLHQDNGYTGRDVEHLQLWFALSPMTARNGALEVVPGHHRRRLEHRWEGDHAVTELEAPRRLVETEAGDVVAFSSLLPHTTGPNTSDSTRLAYVAELLPLDVDDPSVAPPHLVACVDGRPVGEVRADRSRPSR